jgi:hypothetical protein
MKRYTVIKLSSRWSTSKLRREVESVLNDKSSQGFEILSVGYGFNLWWMPTVFITIAK